MVIWPRGAWAEWTQKMHSNWTLGCQVTLPCHLDWGHGEAGKTRAVDASPVTGGGMSRSRGNSGGLAALYR